MEYRPFEITSITATNLKDVNFFSKMRVYVIVSIVGDSSTSQETPTSKRHGTSPAWDFPMRFFVEESKLHQSWLRLVFKLRCSQRIGGDEDIEEVHVPLKKLFDDAEGRKEIPAGHNYQVMTPAGKPRGGSSFLHSFGETISVKG
ncbi:hypothetical protein L1049_019640 [Liquidambar formosana]|uniref:C2 domain-containing protein n=1 Tax=Liquidambar formosana TaxID=63359 RepID=A0AAP0SC04_LIQFO